MTVTRGWSERDKFVGREEELATFRKFLNNPKGGKRTLYIQAAGGQGKTWLIKGMLSDAGNHSNTLVLNPNQIVDMYSTSNRYLEGVLSTLEERITGELGSKDVFQPYSDAKIELEKARKEKEYSQENISLMVTGLASVFRGCLQKIAEERVIILAFDTFENVHDTEVFDWILSDSGLQMPNLVCLVGTRTPLSKEQQVLYLAIEEMVLGGFSDDDALELYRAYLGNTGGVLPPKHEDLIHILNQKSQQNPLELGLALIFLDLSDNSPEKIEKLSQDDFEKQIVAWLGPQINPGPIHIPPDIELNDPQRLTLILMSYLNRRFNKYFLQQLVDNDYIRPDSTVDELWGELNRKKPDLFFVKERPDGEIQLHDKVAELLRKHVLTSALSVEDGLRKFVNDIVKWYEEWLTKAVANDKNIIYSERLAYLLRADLVNDFQGHPFPAPQPDEIKVVLEDYKRQRSDVLARLIIGEAKILLIERFGGEKKYEIYTLLGEIAEQCYEHESAQAYFNVAYQEACNLGDHFKQVEALLNQHSSTFQTSPLQSFEILDLAEKICRTGDAEKLLPRVLYEKGFTYRITNKLLKAADWYELAKAEAARLEDAEMMPIILNDEGYNFLLIGEIQKARVSIRAARDHRYRKYMDLKERLQTTELMKEQKAILEEEVRDAAKMLGLSYSTLGDLARFSNRLAEALTRYQEAMENFEYSNSRYWQAKMYFTIGETYRRIAVADFNAGRSPKYQEMDQLAEENISKSLTVCEQYGFVSDLDTAYRRLGRLYHDRMFRTSDWKSQLEYLDEARQYFSKALSISQKTDDQLEMLESLTELAFLADDYLTVTKAGDKARYEIEIARTKQDIDKLKKYIDECPVGSRVYQFPVFEHLWEIEQAAYFFAIEEFDASLPLYIKGYADMAKLPGYGIARYLQHLDHLVNYLKRLFVINKTLGEEWCKAFIEAWEKEGLMERRPELPGEIEVVRDTNFLLK